MNEIDKKILENQLKLLKVMDDVSKKRYLDFTVGLLAAKLQSPDNQS